MVTEDVQLEDRWLSLTELVRYSGLSLPTLKRYMADPVQPLPVYRIGRLIRVKRSDYDRWLRARDSDLVPRVVSGKGLTPAQRAARAARGYVIDDER